MASSKRGKPEIVFVTGKGGVGKSVVAAALALRAARSGRKTLLVEFGRQSFYERLLDLPPGTGEYPGQPGLEFARWDEEACLREYVGHYLPVARAADLFLGNRVIRALIRAAPTLKELALIGKATGPHRLRWARTDHELMVIDAFSTGHFLALLRAPRGINEAAPVGPVGRQTRTILEVLRDPAKCRFVVVALAEELPVTEALELHEAIATETGQHARLICNKIQPPVDDSELQRVRRDEPGPAAAFASRLAMVRDRQRHWIDVLSRTDDEILRWPYHYAGSAAAVIAALAGEAGTV